MPHPLDGARLKVVRAQEHLDSFKTEGGAFIRTHPYQVISEVYGEHWLISPKMTADPPLRLSTIIGDCVTNARAAIDYIAWELSNKYLVPAVDLANREDRRITAFPIFEHSATDKGYTDRINRLTKRQIPTAALAEITAAQPDVSGNQALFWLNKLVNHDKHRMPILTVGIFGNADIRIPQFRGRAWLIRGEFMNAGLAVKADADLLSGIRSGNVQVDIETAVSIACRNVAMPLVPIERTLEQIIETVANLIPRFDRFFV